MKPLRSILLSLSLLCIAFPASAEELKALLPANKSIAGHSQAEWTQRWWQWASSFDNEDSPVADRTGERCHLRQSGPVWFLAGTYGTQRTIRSCTVPAGKYLFFPLVNYVVYPRGGVQATTCESVTQNAKVVTDDVASLFIDIDGARGSSLETHRLASPGCFDLWARVAGGAKLYPAAANGYYVMLSPLKAGQYELNFGGALPGIVQGVSYTLTVK